LHQLPTETMMPSTGQAWENSAGTGSCQICGGKTRHDTRRQSARTRNACDDRRREPATHATTGSENPPQHMQQQAARTRHNTRNDSRLFALSAATPTIARRLGSLGERASARRSNWSTTPNAPSRRALSLSPAAARRAARGSARAAPCRGV
jgi:hypothetical protein